MSATRHPPASRADAASIEISGVNLSYGANQVLRNIELRVEPGELFGFLGPSGCGKTTLLRLIAGFNSADSGEVKIAGREITGLPPWKRDVGMVFQSYALWPHMSVRRNVAFGLEERRLARPEVARRVDAALDLVGLSALADRKPSQLSGGQQQRVALARTIAIEPKVLLLDEPLSNLDAKMRVQVRQELRELQQRLGITTIFVTHDQEEANAICDRMAVMSDGVVQQVGAPMQLYARPVNLFVANFLGAANIVAGRVVQCGAVRKYDFGGGVLLTIPEGASVAENAKLIFRPQDARIALPDSGENGLPAAVRSHEFLGSVVRYRIRVGKTEVAVDTPFHAADGFFPSDQTVALHLHPSSLLWLAS